MKNTINNTITNLPTNFENEGENNMKTLTKTQKFENFEKSFKEKHDEIYNKIEDATRTVIISKLEVITYLELDDDGTIIDVLNSNSNSYNDNNDNYFVFYTEKYDEDLVNIIRDDYREENSYKEKIEEELQINSDYTNAIVDTFYDIFAYEVFEYFRPLPFPDYR